MTTGEKTMVLLNAEGITKSYTEKPLLKDIDISIHSDEKVGLIGVNGTGKTTLLKILAGVEEAEAGTITMARNRDNVFFILVVSFLE